MALAGALEIQMSANIARLSQDMAQAVGITTTATKQINDAIEKTKGLLEKLGIGLSVGYFVELIRGSIDAAEHLENLSKSTGIAVETLAGLRVLAKQSGTDLDGLAKGIDRMTVAIGKAPEKFAALGVTARDGVGALKQVSDIFNLLPDITQRNALAQAIFSKSWAELAPLLSKGSEEIGKAIEKGTELSGITPELTKQAEEFNNKLVLLTGTGGLLTRIVAPLLPLLNMLADDLLDAQKKAKGADEGFNPLVETLRAVVVLGGNVSFVFKAIGKDAGAMAAQLSALLHGSLAQFAEIHDERVKDAASERAAFDSWEVGVMGVGAAAAKAVPAVTALTDAQKKAQADAAARAKAFLDAGKASTDFTNQLIALAAAQNATTLATSKARYDIFKGEIDQEVSDLKASFDLRLISEQDYISQDTALRVQLATANRDRLQTELTNQQSTLAKAIDAASKIAGVDDQAAKKRVEAAIKIEGERRTRRRQSSCSSV